MDAASFYVRYLLAPTTLAASAGTLALLLSRLAGPLGDHAPTAALIGTLAVSGGWIVLWEQLRPAVGVWARRSPRQRGGDLRYVALTSAGHTVPAILGSLDGTGWAVGPFLGVWLLRFWHGAPFAIVAAASLAMLGSIWWMGMGSTRLAARPATASANPLRYLRRDTGAFVDAAAHPRQAAADGDADHQP